jgi:hypothetical protein
MLESRNTISNQKKHHDLSGLKRLIAVSTLVFSSSALAIGIVAPVAHANRALDSVSHSAYGSTRNHNNKQKEENNNQNKHQHNNQNKHQHNNQNKHQHNNQNKHQHNNQNKHQHNNQN